MNLKKLILINILFLGIFTSFSFGDFGNENFTEIGSTNSSYNQIEKTFYNDGYGSLTSTSGINIPIVNFNGFEGDEPIILIKKLINKIIEIFPFIIFIMLLLGCFRMITSIKDGEGTKGKKIIKQVVLGTILFIASIYIINLVSIFLNGTPIININNTINNPNGSYIL